MDISLMELLILSLASFRLTRLIVFDKITEFMRRPFFDEIQETNESGETEIFLVPKKSRIRGFFGELLSCYWCTGVWVSIFLIVFYILLAKWAVPFLLVMSVAGIAALIEALLQKWLED